MTPFEIRLETSESHGDGMVRALQLKAYAVESCGKQP